MKTYNSEQVMNGTFGELWIDGEYMAEVTAFEATVELSTEEIRKCRTLFKQTKVVQAQGKGNIKLNKVGSYFIEKMADLLKRGKQFKCTITSKLDDPDALGAEYIVIRDATFSSLALASWKNGAVGEESYDFTFSDYEIKEKVEV